jgi:hypothetical protein
MLSMGNKKQLNISLSLELIKHFATHKKAYQLTQLNLERLLLSLAFLIPSPPKSEA